MGIRGKDCYEGFRGLIIMKKMWRLVKTRWLLLIALSLLCWTSTGVTNHHNAVKSEDKIMYALFKDRFTEPIEVMYFLMDDMRLFKLTSNYENTIVFRTWELKRDFKQEGYEIPNVIVIIHNHNQRVYFSDSDINSYRLFKGDGFAGKFYIYVWRTKSIYELAERFR